MLPARTSSVVLLGVSLLILALGGSEIQRAAAAQPTASLGGDYVGTLGGALHLALHITAAADGTLSGTLDSPDQKASGIPCTDFRVQGTTLSFSVPSVMGNWSGTIGSDGRTLAGTWDQGGGSAPLTFTHGTFPPGMFAPRTFVAASKPSAVDGFWLGTINGSLRVQITVKSDQGGGEHCTLDSLDQGAFGLECANARLSSTAFSFDVPRVGGHWEGTLAKDGRTLSGTWSQGQDVPLDFERQAAAIPPPAQ